MAVGFVASLVLAGENESVIEGGVKISGTVRCVNPCAPKSKCRLRPCRSATSPGRGDIRGNQRNSRSRHDRGYALEEVLQLEERRLHHPVFQRGDTQQSLLPIGLRNADPLDRIWVVGFGL